MYITLLYVCVCTLLLYYNYGAQVYQAYFILNVAMSLYDINKIFFDVITWLVHHVILVYTLIEIHMKLTICIIYMLYICNMHRHCLEYMWPWKSICVNVSEYT